MTRILICANNIDEIGGAQRVVHVLAGGLQARGHQVELVGITPFEPRHDFGGEYQQTVLMSKPWPTKSGQTERVRSQLRAEAVSRMVELLKSADQPSVVITAQVWAMEIVADALATLAPSARARWSARLRRFSLTSMVWCLSQSAQACLLTLSQMRLPSSPG